MSWVTVYTKVQKCSNYVIKLISIMDKGFAKLGPTFSKLCTNIVQLITTS